ncbi:MAG TPA: NAD-dependent epimerase/dehydratase family protein [Planktothrix sp.]|jgi:CDP-paratose 2-epimerase
MTIFIAGICGFVGTSITRFLLEQRPHLQIVGIDNFSRAGTFTNQQILTKLGVKVFHGDVRENSDLAALPKLSWVVDAAANPSVLAGVDGKASTLQTVQNNLYGTVNQLELAAQNNAGFTLLSTSRVYGIKALQEVPLIVKDDAFKLDIDRVGPIKGLTANGIAEDFSTEAPISLYGSTKLSSEILALEYKEIYKIPVYINRCGVLAGAGQFGRPDQGIYSFWINAYQKKRPLKYIGFNGQGHQFRDCFHPRDLARLLLKQMDAGTAGPSRCNLGGGLDNGMSLLQLSKWCHDRYGAHEITHSAQERLFDVPWVAMDTSRATSEWDFKLDVSLHDILTEIAVHAEQNPNWLEVSGL